MQSKDILHGGLKETNLVHFLTFDVAIFFPFFMFLRGSAPMVPSSRSFCMMFLTTKQFLSIWPKMRWKWQKIGSLNLEVSSGLFGLGSSIWFNSRRPVKRPSTSLGKEYFWFWRSLFVRKCRRAALREKNGPHTDSSHTGTKYERCYSNLGPGSLGPRNKLKMPWAFL